MHSNLQYNIYINLKVYDPASTSASKRPSVDDDTLIPHKPTPVTVSTNYRDKYKHLIATEIDEPVPIKTVGERNYGFGMLVTL